MNYYKKKSTFHLLLFGVILTGLYACYPKGPEFVDQLDLVATQYDDTYDFGQAKSYYMPDTVTHITNDPNEDEDLTREFDEFFIGEVERLLESRGYERITDSDTSGLVLPDLVVELKAIKSKNTGVGWVPGPGCCYYPPGWGWPGYPWYPGWGGGIPVAYDYTTGSLLIEIADPSLPPLEEKIRLLWHAGFNGLLQGSNSSIKNRMEEGLQQAFEQSPYLKSNQ
ncbi:DUF4136 domain-containing protein [Flexithrix dorotheae]|uniref:DUF4136 domain-containing protein n=1 Tax=Flexithrix dorotheae TaxID=70993 RepID=UPI00035E3814|nr:DUF4136 domain-containing protein [Flexithrix dorotheae]